MPAILDAVRAYATVGEMCDVLRQVWINRADYLYVLPAIVVMLIVIAYPIYYTIELSFFKTPPGLQLRDKIFIGADNPLFAKLSEGL